MSRSTGRNSERHETTEQGASPAAHLPRASQTQEPSASAYVSQTASDTARPFYPSYGYGSYDVRTAFPDTAGSHEVYAYDSSASSQTKLNGKRRRDPNIPNGYPCAECGEAFNTRTKKAKHEKSHLPEGRRPHPCSFCPKRFLYPKDLKRHLNCVKKLHTPQYSRSSTFDDNSRNTLPHDLRDRGPSSSPIALDPDLQLVEEPEWIFELSAYTYEPLEDASSNIRLLRIDSTDYNGHLSCKMKSHLLTNVDSSYIALSYVWGSEPESSEIFLDGNSTMKIKPNLKAAMQALSKYPADTYFWIDALCINQHDVREKNEQVAIMSQIYSSARVVCVWLGDHDEDVAQALRLVGDTNNVGDTQTHCRALFGGLSALKRLMNRHWFQRLWVIQEVVLAQAVTIRCGDVEAPWSAFESVVSLLQTASSHWYRDVRHLSERDLESDDTLHDLGQKLEGLSLSGAFRFLRVKGEICRLDASGRVTLLRYTLLDLLSTSATFDCSDPRDRIYALAGIASDAELQSNIDRSLSSATPVYGDLHLLAAHTGGRLLKRRSDRPMIILTPDYRRSSFHIYKEIFRTSVSSSHRFGNLDVLCRPWAHEGGEGLPSWICRLSRAPFGPTRDSLLPGSREHSLIRKNSNLLVSQIAQDGPIYTACGLWSARYGRGPHFDWFFDDELDDPRLYLRGFKLDIIDTLLEASQSGNISEDWLSLGGFAGDISRSPDELWQTLVANRSADGRSPPPYFRSAFRDAVRMSAEDGLNTAQLKMKGNSFVVEYLERMETVVWGRRLFRSAHFQRLGLGPKEAVPDICILIGVSVPVILRPQKDLHQDRQYYTVIGECYLHDMMDGQALDAQEALHSKTTEHSNETMESFDRDYNRQLVDCIFELR